VSSPVISFNKSIGASTFWPCERALIFYHGKSIGPYAAGNSEPFNIAGSRRVISLQPGFFSKRGKQDFVGKLPS
jgi:hypothetical protein